jgi:hypothetical protein
MKTQFEQMMDGLNDVEAFLAGEQEGFKAHVPHEVDVKAIRNRLGMTQARFSNTFGFSLDAISTGREDGVPQKRRRALCSPSSTKVPLPCWPHWIPLRSLPLSALLNPPLSTSGLIESVRRLVALQNGRLILPRAGRESQSETEKEQLPIAASARETRNRVYERRVLEPVISTHDHNVSTFQRLGRPPRVT